jgi:hypothetical protein
MRELNIINRGQEKFGSLNNFLNWMEENNLSMKKIDEVEKMLN